MQAAGANTQAYADIEQRAKRRQGSDGDDGQEAVRDRCPSTVESWCFI